MILRGVRDYRIRSSTGEIVLGGSAFNIKAKSLRLGAFSEAEVRGLLGQHSEETGPAFAEDALDEVSKLTRGQPWLVNALAYLEFATVAPKSVDLRPSATF